MFSWGEALGLLLSFLKIGALSIGGGYATIPLIEQEIVKNKSWLTIREFTDIIAISQMTPGPLAVNVSTFVGIRIAGVSGAVLATAGCVAAGWAVSLLLYRVLTDRESPAAQRVLEGLRAASTGLIVSAAAGLVLLSLFGSMDASGGIRALDGASAALFAAALAVLRRFRLNPVLLMLLCGIAGLCLF